MVSRGGLVIGEENQECLRNQQELITSHKEKAYVNHCDVFSIFIPEFMQISTKAREVLNDFSRHHITYFSSCFTKKEGLPPTSFRKKLIGHR
ncbi:hypothetical protein [Paenibacillus sp. CAA11]|uniref:hypothetical protein n=1 Tax=Paenibacillus sp. CAA11 TaxID=1532905 RepID=UPI001F197631|nr:hypothetical protein [Paenibacillus sp. CAA11]